MLSYCSLISIFGFSNDTSILREIIFWVEKETEIVEFRFHKK